MCVVASWVSRNTSSPSLSHPLSLSLKLILFRLFVQVIKMHRAVLIFASIIAMATAQGPSTPYVKSKYWADATTAVRAHSIVLHTSCFPDFQCSEEGEKVVDAKNMCWFHECVSDDKGNLSTIPRVCALGSKISYNFVNAMTNPCTINFDDTIGKFDCSVGVVLSAKL